jgi:uncharacterized membrane protein YczE
MNKIVSWIYQRKMNIFTYIMGFLVLGFSVNLLKASTLGTGAWDTVYINAYQLFHHVKGISWITMGMLSFVMALIVMTIVLLYRRQWKYISMLIPVFGVALFIDFWNLLLFQDRVAEQLGYQILFFIAGLLILPFGLTLFVKSTFTAYVFDELMLMFVKITKASKITYVRLVIEFIGISMGLIIGYFSNYPFDQTFGAVNIGSLVLTFTISPVMALYYRLLHIKTTH